ncbi:MAG: hypothetical protein U0798_11175 [Gemmataceae bacterium]
MADRFPASDGYEFAVRQFRLQEPMRLRHTSFLYTAFAAMPAGMNAPAWNWLNKGSTFVFWIAGEPGLIPSSEAIARAFGVCSMMLIEFAEAQKSQAKPANRSSWDFLGRKDRPGAAARRPSIADGVVLIALVWFRS